MNTNLHFCDLAAADCPSEVPQTYTCAVLAGGWLFPAAGERPQLLKVRYDRANGEKTMLYFRARANDEWAFGLDKHPVPLYGVESIREGEPVLMVEGEKSAAALHSLGVSAVGLPGALAAASVDLVPLDGVDVVLWPDNDKVGADAMDILAGRLARTHRRIDTDLLDLPEKGDAADLVAVGDLADSAAIWKRLGPAL